MEAFFLPPSLQATFDASLSLAELLSAHITYSCETTGTTSASVIRQIANQLHVDPRTIQNWVKGRHRPHDEMVQDLVDTLFKLAPVPESLENRLSIMEKQRRAIYSACSRRDENTGLKQEKDKPEADVSPGKIVFHGEVTEIQTKKKSVGLIGALAVTAIFLGFFYAAQSTAEPSSLKNLADGPAADKNSVLIGSFEEPALPLEKPSLYAPKIRGWKVWGNNGGGIQRNNSEWGAPAAPEGVQTAFFHSGDVHMSTEAHIEPGIYNISFHAARRWYGQENPNPIQVLINGIEQGGPITPFDTKFQKYSSPNFTIAKSATYTIELATRSKEAEKGDTFVDKVELNLVAAGRDQDALNSPFDNLGSKLRHWWGR